MTSERKCAVCGRAFTPRIKRQRACSDACRKQRADDQRRDWYRNHKKEMHTYHAKYHAEHREERNAANLDRYYRKKR